MPFYKMSNKIPVDKMSSDGQNACYKMSVDEMPVDKMPLNKMPFYKMPFYKMSVTKFL
jgi:hypothetical protein